jgi:hypothetical protein
MPYDVPASHETLEKLIPMLVERGVEAAIVKDRDEAAFNQRTVRILLVEEKVGF